MQSWAEGANPGVLEALATAEASNPPPRPGILLAMPQNSGLNEDLGGRAGLDTLTLIDFPQAIHDGAGGSA